MVSTNEITNGEFRLLETDNRVNLPSQIPIRILVTRGDVLHA